ncbi:MAG TPA: sigma 54-interacting transcriptional regulator [Methanoregulaceae archaeon]|jgi:transcriptional regulator with GAF, ATPase, and Fis domain|nr:sigma 54-interacting transcriptional regulator [Desulfomonilia bacterium]HQA80460.1 sigma 54-interacting transcriptional regulator [Methanoregulaceae archaeon]
MVQDEKSHNDLQNRLQFEALITDLSARFVRLTSDKVDEEIERALGSVLYFFHGDRCGLIKIIHEQEFSHLTHAFYAPGFQPVSKNLNLYGLYPWMHQRMIQQKKPIILTNVSNMPPEAVRDMQTFEEMGIRSLLSIPVFAGERVQYILTFQTMRAERTWPVEYVQRLQLLAEILVNALTRREADQALRKSEGELEDQLKFERVLSEISARFVSLRVDQIDGAIEEAQRTIVEVLDLDRSVLFKLTGQGDDVEITHTWNKPQWDRLPRMTGKGTYPWAYEKLTRGEIMVFSSTDELPPEASIDKESHKIFGAKSSLGFGLWAGGRFFGALTFTTLSKGRKWPLHLINRLKMVSEIFANALARKNAEEQLYDQLKEIQELKEQLEKDNVYLRSEIKLLHEHGEIIGESEVMRQVLVRAEQVAPTETTVLILGETGTGKELLAREIHAMSKRKERPLVTVNCASLPPTLIESELFGREKGAYTGALSRMVGRFETAEGATLFLDEIGELPHEVQGKLLRFLENGTFERLGSAKTIRLNVRVIAVTNRDLISEVKVGRFRKDLFYRLNIFPITIPPLRERPEDIPLLVWAFVQQFEKKMGKHIDNIPQTGMEVLSRHSWPGNVRELKNVIERAMIISGGSLEIFPPTISAHEEPQSQLLEDIKRGHILRVLEKTRWRIAGKNGAAEILGVKRSTLYNMMKHLGIQRDDVR